MEGSVDNEGCGVLQPSPGWATYRTFYPKEKNRQEGGLRGRGLRSGSGVTFDNRKRYAILNMYCLTPQRTIRKNKMQRIMLKSKIHRCTLTGADLHYDGSIAVDPVLLEAADIVPDEQVHIMNINSGSRITTYAIAAEERGSGIIMLNGPAARSGISGDILTIMSYANVDESELSGHKPKLVFVDEHNRLK